MSYDIQLYQSAFLKRAIENDLGDWSDADPISEFSLSVVCDWLLEKGYIIEHEGQGCREFVHPNSEWGLQVSVFKGEVAFTIPLWDEAEEAINIAQRDAKELATLAGLGYYDSQTGEVCTE